MWHLRGGVLARVRTGSSRSGPRKTPVGHGRARRSSGTAELRPLTRRCERSWRAPPPARRLRAVEYVVPRANAPGWKPRFRLARGLDFPGQRPNIYQTARRDRPRNGSKFAAAPAIAGKTGESAQEKNEQSNPSSIVASSDFKRASEVPRGARPPSGRGWPRDRVGFRPEGQSQSCSAQQLRVSLRGTAVMSDCISSRHT